MSPPAYFWSLYEDFMRRALRYPNLRTSLIRSANEWLDRHFVAVEERMREQGPVDCVTWLRLRG